MQLYEGLTAYLNLCDRIMEEPWWQIGVAAGWLFVIYATIEIINRRRSGKKK